MLIKFGARRCLSTGVRSCGAHGSHTDWNMQWVHNSPQGFLRDQRPYIAGLDGAEDAELKFANERNAQVEAVQGTLLDHHLSG